MRFQRLTIHNIASIEDTVIDFEAKPLVDSEVFLITGKTGAGKSTILDAICLALFATTPRFENTKMQGDTNDGEKQMSVDDPRQLMRRNTGEAFATLTFVGSNGVHYEATWSVSRARKKADGNIQPKSWQLKNLDTDFIYSKDKEIEAEIKNAIGLDFNQFCRTTMLAQGEFTRFLNSKDEEKAEILEKITGMDIYSKIGKKISDITKLKLADYESAKKRIEDTVILTDEQIEDRKKEIDRLNALEKENNLLKNNEIARRDWLVKDNELNNEVRTATNKLHDDNAVVESDDFKRKDNIVKNWNETIEVRGWLAETKKAKSAIDNQKDNVKNLAEKFASLLGGHQSAVEEIHKIGQQIAEIDAFLSAEKTKDSIYKNAQTIVGNLNAIAEGRDTIAQCEKEITKSEKILKEEYIPIFEKIKGEETKAKKELEELENQVKGMEETVEKLQLPKLRRQKDDIKDLISKIDSAMQFLGTLAHEKKRRDDMMKNLSGRFESIKNDEDASKDMVKPIEEAKIKMDTTKEIYDRQIDTVDKFATSLRSKLRVGDVCPVCRQKIESELPHEDVLSNLVSDLKEKYQNAEKEYKDLVEKKTKLDAKIDSESNSYNRDKELFDNDNSVSVAEQKASEACAKCGISSLSGSTPTDLDSKKNAAADFQKAIDFKLHEGDEKEKELKSQRGARDSKRNQVDFLSQRIKNGEIKINDLRGEIDKKNEIIKTKNADVSKAEGNVRSFVSDVAWKTDWLTLPKEFAAELTAAAERYDENVRSRQTLVENQGRAKTNCENVGKVIGQILATSPGWKSLMPSASGNIANLLDRANDINTAVTQATTQLTSAEHDFSENRTKVDDFLKTHPGIDENALTYLNTISRESKDSVESFVGRLKENVVRSVTLLSKANEVLVEHRKTKPVFDEGETIDTLNQRIKDIDNETSAKIEMRGAINRELDSDKDKKAELGLLIKDRDGKKAVYDRWSRLDALLGDATGKTFRKIAQSYVLSSLIRSANTYMKTLTDRYILKVTPGTFVISIEDAYQGYVSRAASTISGGESFLVSLSLALALSDIGQTLSVDTLFIDEGFGTLSGEPLQNAVNTLRSLHTKVGRHVGIISHVEELQERIPVQIQVNQEGNNSSSKVSIVEV